MRYTVIQQINSRLKNEWTFNIFGLNAVFISMSIQEKPKGKRKWHKISSWDRYARSYENTMKEEPTLPDEIKIGVSEMIKNDIKVMTWEEWKK